MTVDAKMQPVNNASSVLLRMGAAAGPIYLLVGLAQILIRPGFDMTRHPLSMMANGDLGWVQVINFFVTAILLMAGAIGLWRIEAGRGRRISAVLIFVYGLSLLGAGLFKADPGAGFPPGTPEAVRITAQGLAHFAFGGVGFLAFIAAALTRAVVHFKADETGWAWFCTITGVSFLAAFVGIASGAGNSMTVLGFYAAVVLAFVWLSMMFTNTERRVR
jgi:hypothetical membrane protein